MTTMNVTEPSFPLLHYIRRLSDGGVTMSLSEILKNQDFMICSTFWYHHFNADGHNHEGLFQLLNGRIEPHIGHDGQQYGYDYYWTMFNFDACEVCERFCWGDAPYFYVVYDDQEGYGNERY
jgi:hypothetical protein